MVSLRSSSYPKLYFIPQNNSSIFKNSKSNETIEIY